MTTQPQKLATLPALVIGDPFHAVVSAGIMVPTSGGIIFDEAAAINVVSDVAFTFAFADNDGDANTKLAGTTASGWRPAGSWIFPYFAEERKLYVKAAGAGTISIERIKAWEPVKQ